MQLPKFLESKTKKIILDVLIVLLLILLGFIFLNSQNQTGDLGGEFEGDQTQQLDNKNFKESWQFAGDENWELELDKRMGEDVVCGNGICREWENCENCPSDCGKCTGENAGDTGTMCSPNERACGMECKEILIDNQNCGSCDNTCSDGETCQYGICAKHGEVVFGDGSQNNNNQNQSQGNESGNSYNPNSQQGQETQNQQSEPTQNTQNTSGCSDDPDSPFYCANKQTNQTNSSQQKGNQQTKALQSQSSQQQNNQAKPKQQYGQCGNGVAKCQAGCRNLKIDWNNCGACGNKCSNGQICSAGSCVSDSPNKVSKPQGTKCGNGASKCNGICKNFKIDWNNCGSCGNKCKKGQTCSAGSCVGSPIQQGSHTEKCTPDCNNRYCGSDGCGGVCGDCDFEKTCSSAGKCVTSSQGNYNNENPGQEYNPRTESNSESSTSSNGEISFFEKCRMMQKVDCSGKCTDINSDNNNCGGCGQKCLGDSICVKGNCSDSCIDYDLHISYPDYQTDIENCGWCRNKCIGDSKCINGSCNESCFDDKLHKTYPNKLTDINHCGACGNKCKDGEQCVGGWCLVSCYEEDGSVIHPNFNYDSNHCGVCNNKCKGNTICHAGTCK